MTAPNDVIYETLVTTESPDGVLHIAPMGVRYRSAQRGNQAVDQVVVMPFRPSTTLDNLLATRRAVLNIVTDTRLFAGCVTGRREWPSVALAGGRGRRLSVALRHLALELSDVQEDPLRPVLTLDVCEDLTHAPFPGLNRAQAAVIEGAVLVSRLHLLPLARIEQEMAIGQTAIDRTASAAEHEAWGWLCEAVAYHRAHQNEPQNDHQSDRQQVAA
ncbi:DUF447 domain-containing protein [Sphaerotilus microaerophilus]|uniref:DUF447 family protein n=1 Tax=Sphaerotilus microaerophilus TaxID=2914710 RepID=A0ABN6PRA6_9BURK|nr:DUF447 domain-containing protein [Sphaerotilus sp. FB-5]BDI06604.1 hypothetical protein CATMQ487_35740 [Sphaerotilus sp. FB-5]